jgi:hypothetical protein
MDAMDLLRSLTQGVNNKVVKEEDDDLEYVVKTSLTGKKVEDFSTETEESLFEDVDYIDNFNDGFTEDFEIEDNVKNNGHKSEEIEVIKEEVAEEVIVKVPEKRKIDRGGNPFKRGPRKSTLERLERERLEKEKKEKEKLEQQEQKKIEKERKEEKKFEDNVPDFSEGIEEKFDYVDEMIKESVREHVESEDIIDDLTSSTENNIINVDTEEIDETDIEELGLEIDDDIKYMEEEDFEDSPIAESIQKIEETIEKQNNKCDDYGNIESIEFEDIVDEIEEPINMTEIEDTLEINEFEPKVVDSIEEQNEKVHTFNEEEKYANCIYRPGMEVEEFLRLNPNYREALYVEHFYSKDTLTRLLNTGIILLKKGKYRM